MWSNIVLGLAAGTGTNDTITPPARPEVAIREIFKNGTPPPRMIDPADLVILQMPKAPEKPVDEILKDLQSSDITKNRDALKVICERKAASPQELAAIVELYGAESKKLQELSFEIGKALKVLPLAQVESAVKAAIVREEKAIDPYYPLFHRNRGFFISVARELIERGDLTIETARSLRNVTNNMGGSRTGEPAIEPLRDTLKKALQNPGLNLDLGNEYCHMLIMTFGEGALPTAVELLNDSNPMARAAGAFIIAEVSVIYQNDLDAKTREKMETQLKEDPNNLVREHLATFFREKGFREKEKSEKIKKSEKPVEDSQSSDPAIQQNVVSNKWKIIAGIGMAAVGLALAAWRVFRKKEEKPYSENV